MDVTPLPSLVNEEEPTQPMERSIRESWPKDLIDYQEHSPNVENSLWIILINICSDRNGM